MLRILVLAAVLGSFVIAVGCGDDEEPAGTVPSETTTTESASSTDTEGVSADAESGADEQEPPSVTDAVDSKGEIMKSAGAFLASPNSEEVCGELVSENLLATAYGDLQGCLNARPKPTLADSVRMVGQPKIDGETATLTSKPAGGLYDGVEVDFTFVREGDEWLIDSVTADVPVGP